MPQRYDVRGSLVALAVLVGVLSSISLGATESATRVCQEQDLMTIHPILPHTGLWEGRWIRLGQNLRRMYCAAQRIMEEPTLERRVPYEDMRQGATRSSEDLIAQLQFLAATEVGPSFMAFTRAFRAFRDLNITIASDTLVAETPADTDAARALAIEQGEAAYAQARAALQTLVARFGPIASPGAARASVATPDYWPIWGWRSSTPEEQGMDSAKLIAMLERVRALDYAIDSITIIRNGYLVTDAYIYPFQQNTKHVIESVTKSFTSALVGIALDKGYIKSVNQPILEFFPEKTIANLDEHKRTITLEHVLTMTSGLDTKDSSLYNWVGFVKMIASEDWAQYVLDLPMAQAPGGGFDYSNGGAHLLSAILQHTTKMSALEFAHKHLFGPLGITNVQWSTDPQGFNIGEGQMMLTPHDMAKFGLLYLHKGRWEDRQIVSEAWVEASTRAHISATVFDGYGYLWWVDSTQYYVAVGYLGQFIFVVPQKNMVVVFTSHLEDDDLYSPKRLLDEYILPAAVSSQPLDAKPHKTAHLDLLLANFAKAPDQGFIWTSEKMGWQKMASLSIQPPLPSNLRIRKPV